MLHVACCRRSCHPLKLSAQHHADSPARQRCQLYTTQLYTTKPEASLRSGQLPGASVHAPDWGLHA